MVVTDNNKYANKITRLKMVGVVKNKYYWHNMIGYNYRMTNICAAIGCAQIEKAKKILNKKREIFYKYKRFLKDLPIKFHEEIKNKKNSYWLVSIILTKLNLRDKLINFLKKQKVETRPCFYPAHTMPMYKKSAKNKKFPIAKILSQNGLNLPSGPNLKTREIKFICEKIKEFLR